MAKLSVASSESCERGSEDIMRERIQGIESQNQGVYVENQLCSAEHSWNLLATISQTSGGSSAQRETSIRGIISAEREKRNRFRSALSSAISTV